jgi:hypothetical protein
MRSLSITSSAAMSRMRLLDRRQPDQVALEFVDDTARLALRQHLGHRARAGDRAPAVGSVDPTRRRGGRWRRGAQAGWLLIGYVLAVQPCRSAALALGAVGRVAVHGVADGAAG